MAAGTYLHLLPVAIFLILPSTFLITYGWSVLHRHVYPILPNISDTGSLPPESCFFSMMLNISAALVGFAVYIRFKEVREYIRARQSHLGAAHRRVTCLNWWSGMIGLVACAGLDLAANFQETNIMYVHFVGVTVCFWGSCLYVLLQTIVSYWMIPEMNSRLMVWLRAGLCLVSFSGTVVNCVTDELAFNAFTGNRTGFLQWSPDDPGWSLHVTASVSEWVIVLALGTFILTFYHDFHRLIFYPPVLEIKHKPMFLWAQDEIVAMLNDQSSEDDDCIEINSTKINNLKKNPLLWAQEDEIHFSSKQGIYRAKTTRRSNKKFQKDDLYYLE